MLNLFQHLFIRCKDVKRQRCEVVIKNKFCCNFTKIAINENSPCPPVLCSSDLTHPFTSPPLKGGEKESSPHPSPIGEGVKCVECTPHPVLRTTFSHTGEKVEIRSSRFTLHPSLKKRAAFTLAEGATHVAYSHNIPRAAFTLAEVLITLGIIGVVAAITIPTLITNHKKKVLPVRLQKFYSTFNNALQMSQVYNGDMLSWELPTREDDEANYQYYNKYILSYMKGIRKCAPNDTKCNYTLDSNIDAENGKNYTRFIFSDGSCFGILTGWTNESNARIHGWFDYNCNGNPNKAGKDEFSFYLNFSNMSKLYTPFQYTYYYASGKKLSDMDREEVKELCKSEPQNCGALIQFDGWVVADDYPNKL